MNTILNDILKERYNYVHALEVEDIYELKSAIENLTNEFLNDYSINQIIEFFNSLTIYCINEVNEDAVNEFNIEDYINRLIFNK